MMRTSSRMRNNPVTSYIILTFVISWGTLLFLIARSGMPTSMEEANAQLPLAIVAMLLGPAVSGLVLTGVVHGRIGFQRLRSQAFMWHVPVRWYAVAALTGPLVLSVVQFLLIQVSPAYRPGIFDADNIFTLVLMGIAGGVLVGICEEIGWTGFATPMLRMRQNVLVTGLLIGGIWGAWHILSNNVWVIRTYTGELSTATYGILRGLGFLIGQLPPYRILMVWVYDRTSSLLIVILMHAALTTATLILSPAAMSGVSVLYYDLALALAMWAVAIVVIVTRRDEFVLRNGDKPS